MKSNSLKSPFIIWKEKHLPFTHQWSFKSLSRTFLHLFGIYPELHEFPASMACPEDRTNVVQWEESLRRCGLSDSPTTGAEDREQMNGIQVLELLRMKEKSGVKHEYFAVKFKIRRIGNVEQYLRIERAGGDPLPTTSSLSSNASGNPTSSSTSLKSSKARAAWDTVMRLENLPKDDKKIETVSVKDFNIRLIDVAIAAKLVHDHDDRYRLLKGQCFWFSDMVMRVLERQFSTEPIAEQFRRLAELMRLQDDLEHPGAFTPAWKAEIYSAEGGTWTWIPIYNKRMDDINDVATALRAELDKFTQLVQEADERIEDMASRDRQLKDKDKQLKDALAQSKMTEKANRALREEIARLKANQAGSSQRQ